MIHALASTLTVLAVLLTSDYVLRRFPVAGWRLPLAVATLVTAGLNTQVFQFGAIGQAYGFCLFGIVLAFRFAVLTPNRRTIVWPALAGLAAGAAAAGSLLTAPVAPVLLLWLVFQSRTGNRWIKGVAFLCGVITAFLPLIWLFLEDPRKVFFSVFDYHFYYRQMDWEGAIQHDIEVLVFWVDSSQALLLGLLAVAGLFFVARRSDWDRSLRGVLSMRMVGAGRDRSYLQRSSHLRPIFPFHRTVPCHPCNGGALHGQFPTRWARPPMDTGRGSDHLFVVCSRQGHL